MVIFIREDGSVYAKVRDEATALHHLQACQACVSPMRIIVGNCILPTNQKPTEEFVRLHFKEQIRRELHGDGATLLEDNMLDEYYEQFDDEF